MSSAFSDFQLPPAKITKLASIVTDRNSDKEDEDAKTFLATPSSLVNELGNSTVARRSPEDCTSPSKYIHHITPTLAGAETYMSTPAVKDSSSDSDLLPSTLTSPDKDDISITSYGKSDSDELSPHFMSGLFFRPSLLSSPAHYFPLQL